MNWFCKICKESEEESIESDSDDEDFNEEDDDSEAEGKEQLDLDICPSGLKQELFDQVCQLREKRLDLGEKNLKFLQNLTRAKIQTSSVLLILIDKNS